MDDQPLPTREALKRVIDTLFLEILNSGERRRAMRQPRTPPDWAPWPTLDERYDGLAPEQWGSVLTQPELEAQDWSNSIIINQIDAVEPLVTAVMSRLGVPRPSSEPDWLHFLRIALVITAQAHYLDSKREAADYSDGFPEASAIKLSAFAIFDTAYTSAPEEVYESGLESQKDQMSTRRKSGPAGASEYIKEGLSKLLKAGQHFKTVAELSRSLHGWLRVEHGETRAPETINNILNQPDLKDLRDAVCLLANETGKIHGKL